MSNNLTAKVDLFSFWQDKEKELGKKITVIEVAKAIGVSRNTLKHYLENKVERPDMKVVTKICDYFNVPAGPIPFLIYESD